MHESFLFSGFGGQGVMFVGQLLAYAAMDEGLEVTWIPSYGPEMRGGTAHCFVVISDRPIGSPVVSRPKTAIVFNNPSFEKYELQVEPGGLLASNSSLITATCQRNDITFAPIPASSIADELGSLKIANLVMLGGVLTAHPVLSLDALKHALDEHIPARRRELLELNFKAVDRGADYVASRVLA
jgi:2-oxoglutarate ferredoxin oxidoreductase subunit gamma